MEGVQLSDTDFNYLKDGSSFDVADTAGRVLIYFGMLLTIGIKA